MRKNVAVFRLTIYARSLSSLFLTLSNSCYVSPLSLLSFTSFSYTHRVHGLYIYVYTCVYICVCHVRTRLKVLPSTKRKEGKRKGFLLSLFKDSWQLLQENSRQVYKLSSFFFSFFFFLNI